MPGWVNYRFVSRSYKICPDTVLSAIWKLKIGFSCKPSQFLIWSHLKMCIIRPNQIFCSMPLLSGHQIESVRWINKRHFLYLKKKTQQKKTHSLWDIWIFINKAYHVLLKRNLCRCVNLGACMPWLEIKSRIATLPCELSLKLPEIFLPLPPIVPQSAWMSDFLYHVWLYMSSRDLNPGPHAWVTGALPCAPSPHPLPVPFLMLLSLPAP